MKKEQKIKKTVGRYDVASIILHYERDRKIKPILKKFPDYTTDQIMGILRSAGFDFIKRGGKWYEKVNF